MQTELERVEWNIAAPQLIDIEVLQVLRRRVTAGITSIAHADEARELLRDVNLRYYDHAILRERIWQLRDNVTAYDAAYIALAELLEVPLLTSDVRLAQAPGNEAQILLVE